MQYSVMHSISNVTLTVTVKRVATAASIFSKIKNKPKNTDLKFTLYISVKRWSPYKRAF